MKRSVKAIAAYAYPNTGCLSRKLGLDLYDSLMRVLDLVSKKRSRINQRRIGIHHQLLVDPDRR
jgi:hypothetical protein